MWGMHTHAAIVGLIKVRAKRCPLPLPLMWAAWCREDTPLNPTDYANLLWAASRLPVALQGTALWRKVQGLLSTSLRGWRVKELCTALWSLGMLKLNPGHDILRALLERVAPHAEVLPLKHTVSAITGASFLNHMPDEEFLARVEEKLALSLMKVGLTCLLHATRYMT